ncbi:MAG: hypothetical protein ACPIOQ_32830, partial [Promethearchaeia archaeon]
KERKPAKSSPPCPPQRAEVRVGRGKVAQHLVTISLCYAIRLLQSWFALARVALAPPEHKTAACHSLPMQLDALPNGRRFPGPFSTLGRSCPCNNFLHSTFQLRSALEQRPARFL